MARDPICRQTLGSTTPGAAIGLSLLLACAGASPSAAAEERGAATVKLAPRPVAEVRVVPDGTSAGWPAREQDGSRTTRIRLGQALLTFTVMAESSGEGWLQVAVDDGRGGREVRIPLKTLQLADEVLAEAFAGRTAERDTIGPWESVAAAIRKRVGATEWSDLERIAHELERAAAGSETGAEEIRSALAALSGGTDLAAKLAAAGPAGLPKSEACAGAIGRFLLTAGAAGACWTTNGATGGIATAACLFLSAATVAGAVDIANYCGGGPSDPFCDCRNPPDCMCCDVAPGDVCTCYCPGEECCDWPDPAAPAGVVRHGR